MRRPRKRKEDGGIPGRNEIGLVSLTQQEARLSEGPVFKQESDIRKIILGLKEMTHQAEHVSYSKIPSERF